MTLASSPPGLLWSAIRRKLAARALWDAREHVVFLQRNYATLDPRLRQRLARARQELESAWIELTSPPS